MASRSISPDPQGGPHFLGSGMRQGSDEYRPLPHGLASGMKQGKSESNAANPRGIGSAMKQGGKKKK